jgi:hypothetical protein
LAVIVQLQENVKKIQIPAVKKQASQQLLKVIVVVTAI